MTVLLHPSVSDVTSSRVRVVANLEYAAAAKRLIDGGTVLSTVDKMGRTVRDWARERNGECVIKVLNGEEFFPKILVGDRLGVLAAWVICPHRRFAHTSALACI